jgi:hypothetical protein
MCKYVNKTKISGREASLSEKKIQNNIINRDFLMTGAIQHYIKEMQKYLIILGMETFLDFESTVGKKIIKVFRVKYLY